MQWLVGWFKYQGKKGVCIGKKVHCGPVLQWLISYLTFTSLWQFGIIYSLLNYRRILYCLDCITPSVIKHHQTLFTNIAKILDYFQ